MVICLALVIGIVGFLTLAFLLRKKTGNNETLSKEEKFSRLLDQSVDRVFSRFIEEIPMANMFLKGATAEKLKKMAKKELEPLWNEVQALEIEKSGKRDASGYTIWLIMSLIASLVILMALLHNSPLNQ